jgi:hypothetical protein
MMRAALMFLPMTILAAVALDVAVPAAFLLVCVLIGRATALATRRAFRGGRA